MSVSRISATWIAGSVVTPDYLTRVTDDCNGSLGAASIVRRFRDDFNWRMSAMTSTGILANTWDVGTLTNGSLAISTNPGALGSSATTAGVLTVSNTGAAALNFAMQSAHANLSSTQDLMVAWRVRVATLASLDTVANGGLVLDFGNFGFAAGSDSAYWNTQTFAGVRAVTTVPLADGQWYTLRVERIGGTVTWYIDDVVVKTSTGSTSSSTAILLNISAKTTAVASATHLYVDYAGYDLPSASAG